MPGFELEQGEWVRVLVNNIEGEVVSVDGDEVLMAMQPSGFKLRVSRERVVRATRPQTGPGARHG